MESLRILVLNKYCWRNPLAGGAEARLREVSRRWAEWGHEVHLHCGGFPGAARREMLSGVQVARRGTGPYLSHLLGPLEASLLLNRFDVVYEDISPLPWLSPLYTRRNLCIIHHLNRGLFFHNVAFPLALAAYALESTVPLLYQKTATIVVNPSMKAELESLGWRRVSFIPSGVDASFYHPGAKSDKPLVLFVGRLEYRKGLDLLIRASRLVSARVPKAEFIVVGDGPLLSHLKSLVPFRFLGRASDELKRDLLQLAWVTVVPSRVEGWGLVVLEANACGTIVLANDVPGLRSSVSHGANGFLVNCFSEKEFASKLVEMLESPGKEWQACCREHALRYSWDQTAQRELEVIRSVT